MERRVLKGKSAIALKLVCSVLFVIIGITAFIGAFPPLIQRGGFLMFVVPLIFILYPCSKKASQEKVPFYDIALSILATLSFGWVIFDYARIASRIPYVSPVSSLDLIFGIVAVVLILEATRRILGMILVIITSFFLAYTFFGPYIQGVMSFKPYPFERIIEHFYLVPEGIFNIMTGLASTYLFTFIAFGVFLVISKADRFYMDLCLALVGKSRGGSAKVAILSSGLVGMLTGNTMSNVMMTGSITIPMMKKSGFKGSEAAAIATAASTGGAIAPPVMGAGVFIMSGVTGIPLIKIIVLSIIPAVIYFASLFVIGEIKSRRYAIVPLRKDELPDIRQTFKAGTHLLIPFVVLIFLLAAGRTPFISSTIAILLIIFCSGFRKETRMGPKKIIEGFESSVKNMMTITAVCACAALIMGALTLSGLIMKMTSILILASQGVDILALLLIGVASTLIGMGMPVTLSYILISTLGAPALTQLGIPLLAAHLAIFWYSQTSTITPPVCMTAFVAAEIAQEKNFMKVGLLTLNYAKFFYIIPMLFIFTPLLSENIQGPIRVLIQVIPVIVVITSLTERFLLSRLNGLEMTGLLISLSLCSIALVVPSPVVSISLTIGGSLFAGMIYFIQKSRLAWQNDRI